MSWPNAKLGDVAEFINGYAFKPKHWGCTGKKIIRIQNLTNATKPYNKTTIDIDEKFFVSRGDILVSWSATLDVFEWRDEDALLNQHIFKIIPNRNIIDLRYFKFMLKSSITLLLKYTRGSTMKHVNRGDFLNSEFPLPPLETQKQIAAILEKADQLRKDCQQMEKELNSLAQAVFIELFGDPVSNPMGWEKSPLSNIVESFQGGKSIVAADDESTTYKNRVLKISAITTGEFLTEETKPLPSDYVPPDDHFVKKGDLLFSRANTTELVGATAMVFSEPENIAMPDKLWRFVWQEEASISPIFIWRLLCIESTRREISKLSSGSGGSMKNISKSKLNTLSLISPPLEKQNQYEKIYLQIRKELNLNCLLMEFVNNNFSSLMQKAFKGELDLK